VFLAVLTVHLIYIVIECFSQYLQYQSPLIPSSIIIKVLEERIVIAIVTFLGIVVALTLQLKENTKRAIIVCFLTLLAQVIVNQIFLVD